MAREIVCRATVGLHNPYTRKTMRAGTFVSVDPEDEKYGPLIGMYLIPVDKRTGVDLPEDQWPGRNEPELELDSAAAVAAPEAPAEEGADPSVRPQEPPGDAPASPEGETFAPLP